MSLLKEKLAKIIPAAREEVGALLKQHGDKTLSKVTVAQAYGGMRGVMGLICETSLVSPDTGLIIRGTPVSKLTDRLPEEILWLLLTGGLPSKAELADLQKDLTARAKVPEYVWAVLKALPAETHPMCMISCAIASMQRESVFARMYNEKALTKQNYWEPTLEDALNLIAKLPGIAAAIYRQRFNKGPRIELDPKLDWAANYAHMLGIKDPTGEFKNLMRLYMVLHSDHESGNVSAHVCHTVGSALSDVYYSVSAGLNGLAGPLHGLANQECLQFVLKILKDQGGVPTKEQLKKACWDLLNAGHVIPGYGHAVLRCPDPRYVAFLEFGKRVCPKSDAFRVVADLYEVVPGILQEQGKAKNPWPNVDAGSGSLLYHFGMKEFDYYTVLFGVSRTLGIASQLVINRALGAPIERPKSVATSEIKQMLAEGKVK
jgi:citrate synthase